MCICLSLVEIVLDDLDECQKYDISGIDTYLVTLVTFYNTVTYCVIFNHIYIIIANFDLFHVNDRVLGHQMCVQINRRAPAWKGDPLRYSHQFHARKIANCACWRHWNHSLYESLVGRIHPA